MNPRKSAPSCSGFTLIELLVVIAIIAILAAILFPVFAQARETARIASCSSNIRQITLAFRQYSQDYDENLPPRRTPDVAPFNANWKHIIQPYTKSYEVLRCPSNPASKFYDETDPALGKYVSGTVPTYRGYFYFQAYYKQAGNQNTFQNYKEVAFGYPATTVLIGENKADFPDFGPWIDIHYNGYGNGKFSGTDWGAWHRASDRRVNIGFMDGHVKFTDWNATCQPINSDNTNMWAYDPSNPPFTMGMCVDLAPDESKGKFP